MSETLRQRALAEAHSDPEARLRRVRGRDEALARIAAQAERRERVARPVGVFGLLGGGVLGALTAAAVVATPVGWIAAGAMGSAGLAGLVLAGRASRRRELAASRRKSLRLGHEGRALEIDALLARLTAVRSAMGADYARYEHEVLGRVDPRKHVENAALLQEMRARQLAAVARLDGLRGQALALRERLVKAAITAEVDAGLEAIEPAREAYRERLARTAFERDDARHELARLEAETEALEALEAEYASSVVR